LRIASRKHADTIELISPLAPDACARLLGQAMDPPWRLFGVAEARGRVRGGRFRVRKRLRFGNSLQTVLFGAMRADGARTRIQCRFGVDPVAKFLLVAWFVAVALLGVVLAVLCARLLLAGPPAHAARVVGPGSWALPIATAVPPVMLLLGYALARYGRWLARDERRFLIDFLRRTLLATDAEWPGG
jgi:hypothetical protein